jgi:hypothetical protein
MKLGWPFSLQRCCRLNPFPSEGFLFGGSFSYLHQEESNTRKNEPNDLSPDFPFLVSPD